MASASAALLLTPMAILCTARCLASDTISSNSAISGSQTIVSSGGAFELGFFRPAAAPVSDAASSQLAMAADGNLVLINEASKLVWSTNASSASSNGTAAVILDSGNLVLRRDGGEVLWQSMDHPTDTWLPGGRLGLNKVTGDMQTLDSWTSSADPAPGVFTLGIDTDGSSQYFLYWNRAVRYWSSGEWNGHIFAGIPEMMSHYMYNFEFVSDANASYFTYSQQDPTVISRLVLDVSGQVRQLAWLPSAGEWMLVWTEPHQLCDVYAICGAFGVCDEKGEPFCSCLAGFRPASVGHWELGDHTHGCRRNTSLRCGSSTGASTNGGGDGFLLMPGISLPRNRSFAQASGAQDCRLACLRSCDCNAYSYGGSCALWYGDLLNLERLADDAAGGDDGLYLRLSAMDMPAPSGGRKRKIIALASIGSAASILAACAIVSLLVWMFRRRQRSMRFVQAALEGGNLVAFKYGDVRRATKNFSEKLGGGSFGSVYRGTLPGPGGGAAVAVKKLEGPLSVGVGDKQFRNEVRTIGTIQHVNLVRLRGFSSRGGERLLVYDYMPNGSLDRALFGGHAGGGFSAALSWPARFQIALGAARGLLYLHSGCRDCIIVADFGMAKLVGRDFSRVLTSVRGTIGYLAPEWISGVPVTAKADVYSYGMVLLELISGRRNARCWAAAEEEEGRMSDYFPLVAARKVAQVGLLDERLNGDADVQELERACRVACWCVQDDEASRPTMEQVVQALEGVVIVDVPPIPTSLQALAENAAGSMYKLSSEK
ncbi:hypothetical protein ACP70R_043541 [Stipagrostis hirtigluma subsp. patula]